MVNDENKTDVSMKNRNFTFQYNQSATNDNVCAKKSGLYFAY